MTTLNKLYKILSPIFQFQLLNTILTMSEFNESKHGEQDNKYQTKNITCLDEKSENGYKKGNASIWYNT